MRFTPLAALLAMAAGFLCLGEAAPTSENAPAPDRKGEASPGFKIVRILKGHSGPVRSVSFSPDGKRMVSAGDRTFRLWDAATGKQIWQVSTDELAGTSGFASKAVFVDGGRAIACEAGGRDGIHLLDARTGKVRTKLHLAGQHLYSTTVSRDGKFLACIAIGTGEDVMLWDLTSGKRLWRIHFPNPTHGPRSAVFAPDGKTLAVGMSNGNVSLYDAANGKELRWLMAREPLRFLLDGGLEFSPDGKFLAVGAAQGLETMISLWDVTRAKVAREMRWGCRLTPELKRANRHRPGSVPPHEPSGLYDLAFSPDGKTLAVTCYDRKVRLWEVTTGQLRHQRTDLAVRLAFSPDGTLLALAGAPNYASSGIRLYDWRRSGLKHPRPLTVAEINQLWKELGAADATLGHRAIVRLAASPKQAVELLGQRLRRVIPVAPAKLDRLVADLDNDRYAVRERASQQLAELGRAAESKLRAVLSRKPSAEVRVRIDRLLSQLSQVSPDQLRHQRGVEILEYLRTPEARRVLQQIASGAAGAFETEEAKAALGRLKHASPVTP